MSAHRRAWRAQWDTGRLCAVQVLLNPLHDPDEKIKPNEQVGFHQAVLGAARKNHIY